MPIREIRILVSLSLIGAFALGWFVHLLSSSDSFFSKVPYEDPQIELQEKKWDEYERQREIRNKLKMIKSYDELMSLGQEFTQRKNYHDAAAAYWYAKTIFPLKEEPRRFLSESYMKLCAEYGEYCKEAKKEVFYAFRYVKDSSNYFPDMLDMASGLDLYPHLDRHENDVMRMIYEEKELKPL